MSLDFLSILSFLIMLFILVCIIILPIVLIAYWIKIKKIRNQIPEELVKGGKVMDAIKKEIKDPGGSRGYQPRGGPGSERESRGEESKHRGYKNTPPRRVGVPILPSVKSGDLKRKPKRNWHSFE